MPKVAASWEIAAGHRWEALASRLSPRPWLLLGVGAVSLDGALAPPSGGAAQLAGPE